MATGTDKTKRESSRSLDVLQASAAFGVQIAALLDTETDVEGVTKGKFADHIKGVADLTPSMDYNLSVTANWGFPTRTGIMPGRGKLDDQRESGFIDIYLNDTTRWQHIPVEAWEYTIGGYQVLKKWLSYRTRAVINRPLTNQEANEFKTIARRITALIHLEADLDTNYQAIKRSTIPLT